MNVTRLPTVREFMDTYVDTLSPDMDIFDAVNFLLQKRVTGAPVTNTKGELVGILSERDYARKVVLKGRLSKEMKVREIMASPVFTVRLRQTVDECMTIMTERRIRHLPVVEDEKVLGVLSIGDLVKWIISEQQETIQQLHNYIAGRYPG